MNENEFPGGPPPHTQAHPQMHRAQGSTMSHPFPADDIRTHHFSPDPKVLPLELKDENL